MVARFPSTLVSFPGSNRTSDYLGNGRHFQTARMRRISSGLFSGGRLLPSPWGFPSVYRRITPGRRELGKPPFSYLFGAFPWDCFPEAARSPPTEGRRRFPDESPLLIIEREQPRPPGGRPLTPSPWCRRSSPLRQPPGESREANLPPSSSCLDRRIALVAQLSSALVSFPAQNRRSECLGNGILVP